MTTILLAVWKFLKGVPWQVWVFVAVVAAAWWYGEVRNKAGQAQVRAEWAEAVARGKKRLDQLKEDQAKVTIRTETVYVDKIRVIHEKGQTIVQRIPTLIPADACLLPPGFRLLHDSAVAGHLPDTTHRFDAGPGGFETVAWRPWRSRPAAGGGSDGGRELHALPSGGGTVEVAATMDSRTGGADRR